MATPDIDTHDVRTTKTSNAVERYRIQFEEFISATRHTLTTWRSNVMAFRLPRLNDKKFWIRFYSAVMPVIAFFLCYAGVTLVTSQGTEPQPEPHPDQAHSDRQDHAKVIGLWGKGAFQSWLLTAIAIQLDVFLGLRSWLDWPRWASVLGYSATALGFQLWHAYKGEFDARYTAAQYVADKGMEALCLTYVLKCARAYRQGLATQQQEMPSPATQPQKSPSVYLVWPCYVLAGSWVGARAMTNGHEIYSYPQHIIKASSLWHPPIPGRFRPLLPLCGFVAGALAVSPFTRGTTRQRLAIMTPVGIWTAFAALHVGLCNNPTSFALAPSQWTDPSQIFPLGVAGLTFIYGVLRPHVKCLRWGAADYHRATDLPQNPIPEPGSSRADDTHELLSIPQLRSSSESDGHDLQSAHYSDSRREVSREMDRSRTSRSHSRNHERAEEHTMTTALVDESNSNGMVGLGTTYGENVDRS